jgi:hypothetical protein
MNSCSIKKSRDGVRYVANKDGDFLFDVSNTDIKLHDDYKQSQFYDWRRFYTASEIKSKCTRRIPKHLVQTYNNTWYKEGDNVLLSLMRHKGRSLNEAKFMLKQCGLKMNEEGIAVKI